MFALRRLRRITPLVLAIFMMAAISGCSRPSVTFVDTGASYDETSVMTTAEGVDMSQLAKTPSAEAAGLRSKALIELRSLGGNAVPLADLLTKTFSAETRGVPVYFERATFKGKPAVVMIEAAGPDKGKLATKRVWVLDEQGGVLFVGSR